VSPLLAVRGVNSFYLVTILAASAGYRIVRAGQMATRYGWLFDRAGPFGWRRKSVIKPNAALHKIDVTPPNFR
jgi:hypothetical protein